MNWLALSVEKSTSFLPTLSILAPSLLPSQVHCLPKAQQQLPFPFPYTMAVDRNHKSPSLSFTGDYKTSWEWGEGKVGRLPNPGTFGKG